MLNLSQYLPSAGDTRQLVEKLRRALTAIQNLFNGGAQIIQAIGVLDKDLTAPPADPADGDAYIVAGGGGVATGAWALHENQIAIWLGGLALDWHFIEPEDGLFSFVADDGNYRRYNAGSSTWTVLPLEASLPQGLEVTDAPTFAGLTLTGGLSGTTAAFSADIQARNFVGRNLLINGGFDIWQRGTSIAGNSRTYGADCWAFNKAGSGTGFTMSRQTGTTARYACRLQRDSGQTFTNNFWMAQLIETANAVPHRGKFLTLTFKVKAGANYSGGVLSIFIQESVDVDATHGASNGNISNPNTILSTTVDAPTTLQGDRTVTTTAAVSSNANSLNVRIEYTPSGTAGTDDWVEVEMAQLEPGEVATEFEARPVGQVLNLAKRYFQRIDNSDGAKYLGAGQAVSATFSRFVLWYPEMRVSPTLSVSNVAALITNRADGTEDPASSVASVISTKTSMHLAVTSVNLVAGNATRIRFTSLGTEYLDLSAEL